jgi:hypothetical protein
MSSMSAWAGCRPRRSRRSPARAPPCCARRRTGRSRPTEIGVDLLGRRHVGTGTPAWTRVTPIPSTGCGDTQSLADAAGPRWSTRVRCRHRRRAAGRRRLDRRGGAGSPAGSRLAPGLVRPAPPGWRPRLRRLRARVRGGFSGGQHGLRGAPPIPGTSAISSRRGLAEPFHRAEVPQQRLAAGLAQTGHAVQAETVIRLDRRCRWKVIANRCASSRTRCSRYSALGGARQDHREAPRPGSHTSSSRLARPHTPRR